MDKITVYNRTDGKDNLAKQGIIEQKLIPGRCIKIQEGVFITLIKDEKGWCWDSTMIDRAARGTSYTYSVVGAVLIV